MFKKIVSIALAGIMLTACAGDKSVKVTALQKKDKNLSCNEVMLEINESEFYRQTAEKNKNPKIKSLIMPLGYISTYMDAGEAVDAADARIDYLNRIYDIMKCDSKAAQASVAAYPPHSDYNPAGGGYVSNNVGYAEPIQHNPSYDNQENHGTKSAGNQTFKDDWYW